MKDIYSPMGSTVIVPNGNVEKAIRTLKKKIQEGGKLQELRDREAYTKPSIERKKNKAKAKNRWAKKVASEQFLPKKF